MAHALHGMKDVVAVGARAPRLESVTWSLRMRLLQLLLRSDLLGQGVPVVLRHLHLVLRVLCYLTMGAQLTMLVDLRLLVVLILGQG